MRTGRPVNKDTQFKIIVHNNGGHRCASSKVCSVDAQGKKHYVYKHRDTVEMAIAHK